MYRMNVDETIIRHFIEPFLAHDDRISLRKLYAYKRDPGIESTWLETCGEGVPWPGLEMTTNPEYCKIPDHWDNNMIMTAAYLWAHHHNPTFGKHTQSVMKHAYPHLNIRSVDPTQESGRSFLQIYQTPNGLVDTVFVYVENNQADFFHDAKFAEDDYEAFGEILAETTLADDEGVMYSYRVCDLQPAATSSCPVFQWFEKAGYYTPLVVHVMLSNQEMERLVQHFMPTWEALKTYTHDELIHILYDLGIAARPKAFKWQPYHAFSDFLPSADLVSENFYDGHM